MKAIAALSFALLSAAGCGKADVRFTDYHVSLAQSYEGSPAQSNSVCLQDLARTAGTQTYTFFYQRITYESGDSFVSCAVISPSQTSGSKSYFASDAGILDGSCAATLIEGGQTAGTWTFTRSGSTTSAAVSSSSASLNGWTETLQDCT